jgi:hypothetical protein
MEVTPPTDKDAYGGWWVTIYDERMLTEQRATEAELAAITIAPSQGKILPRATPTAVGIRPAPVATSPLHWQEHDLKQARPAPPTSQESRVYKRGVHRKNGTYIVST